jgi:polar amino acid transport system substrate-binding protein
LARFLRGTQEEIFFYFADSDRKAEILIAILMRIVLWLAPRFLAALAVAVAIATVIPVRAQTKDSAAVTMSSARELVIGTKEAPPFSMKGPDGAWQGISIELWCRLARDNNLRYRFVEESKVQDLLDGVAAGKYDVVVAAMTPTAVREQTVDFTQPFYASGLGIAVPFAGLAGWRPVLRAMTSFDFLQAVMALVGLALVAGFLIWLFERKGNENFGGGVTRGISSGVLWSASTMTQRHAGNFNPQTVPGRIVAIFWMVGSIVAIAVFTAGITSALTTRQLRGAIHSIGDLSSVRVGVITGTSAEETLGKLQIAHRDFASLQDSFKALQAGKIDALVHDKPLLAWAIRKDASSSIELIDATLGPQNYAFVVPDQSPFRKKLDIAILAAIHGDWWDQMLFQYFGVKS